MERVYNNRSTLTLSQRLAHYLYDLELGDIDAVARNRAKDIIAYHVSLAFRSLYERQSDAEQAIAVTKILSDGGGRSTVLGQQTKVTLADAALANCTLMRGTGLDDVIFPVGVHPALVTLPIAFAVGEHQKSTGTEIVAALVAGYEIMGKFGTFSWTEGMPRRPTMLYGPFGAVVVAGRLLRLSCEKMAACLCYAAHTAMGLAEHDSGQPTHHYGMICRNGLTGAYLAQAGIWASPTVLEGRYGFLEAFCPSVSIDVESMMDSFGSGYSIIDSLEKRYPGTALNQVPIEAMRNLVKEEKVTADDVSAITLTIPIERRNISVIQSTGPFDNAQNPRSSAPYHMAMLLLDHGEHDLTRFKQYSSTEIVNLLDKTKVVFVEGKPLRYAKVEVATKDGRCHVREGVHFAFPIQDHLTIIERYAAPFLPKAQIVEFVDALRNLEHVPDFSRMLSLLAPQPG